MGIEFKNKGLMSLSFYTHHPKDIYAQIHCKNNFDKPFKKNSLLVALSEMEGPWQDTQ
jgi:hypothetical protein